MADVNTITHEERKAGRDCFRFSAALPPDVSSVTAPAKQLNVTEEILNLRSEGLFFER